jgi:predicted CopG family antitoxin
MSSAPQCARPLKRPRTDIARPPNATPKSSSSSSSSSAASVAAYATLGTPSLLQTTSRSNKATASAAPQSPSDNVGPNVERFDSTDQPSASSASSSSRSSSSSHSSSSSSSSSAQPSVDAQGHPIRYADDVSVYSELAALRRENAKLSKRLARLCPKKKRLDTTLHTVSNKHNKVKKRALARQTSVATDAALNEIAMSAERHVTTNLLAEHIVDTCGSSVGHADFEKVMRRPNFVHEFLTM